MEAQKEIVSVIIPTTKNQLHLAERCKKSILDSDYKNTEVLIINEGKRRSEQRNLGISRAAGTFIIYLDSDQYVHPKLLSECVVLMNDGYDALYIPEVIVTPGRFGRLRNWERSFYDGTDVDCIRFFKKKGCPKFSTDLDGPEDSAFDHEVAGYRTITKYPLYHEDGIGIIDYFKKKIHYTKSMKKYSELWPDAKVLNFKYRCWDVFTSNGKWKKLLKHPIKAIGVFTLIFIRGVIYLWQK